MAVEVSFGRWLQRRRKALDLTQEELAQRVGCAAETLRKIEADVRRPSRQIAQRLAEALEIPDSDRPAFIRAARSELGVDRLAPPTEDIPQVSFMPSKALPSGTVTFLFTEIEGSTRLWEQYPSAIREALSRHNAILQQAIKEYGGVIFKSTGKGICAAFTRAEDALQSALAAQQSLSDETWEPIGALRVRMALHTGTAEAGAGEYVGRPLNRVDRLLAAGHGGQILLTRATQELVRDELTTDVELHELGEYRLKDLTHPEYIYQVITPQLPTKFPPLNTIDSCANNLPVQPTPLIDRDLEVAHVCNLLRGSKTRLVTLVGPGGVGKTRLALQVAAELATSYPKGVYFVPLATLRDLELVTPTIAQTLGVTEARGGPLIDALRDYLRTKQILLLLDNFEQVVGASPLISQLLAAAPQLSVLVTSRTVLRLRGEKVFPVPPLGLPDSQHAIASSTISNYAAVQLFIERAQDTNPNLVFTSDNTRVVAQICLKLDGLPLAIELAAPRIKLFSPETLLVRLEERLPLLTGGARDLPMRQQTLRDTLEWSYQLLEPMEQVLFRRLAVFSGGCTIVAATAVCNPTDDPQLDVLNGLVALVDQSLLRQMESEDGESRFEMLETVREYALAQLVAHSEVTLIERLHINFFLAFAEAAEPKLTGKQQSVWMEQLEADYPNLRAALDRALECGDAEMALRLSGALWQFWLRRCVEEGLAWLNRAIALTSRDPSLSPSLRAAHANALYRAGFLANSQGDYGQANELCEDSLSLFQSLGDTLGISWARYTLASAAFFQGESERARMLLEQSMALFRELGEARGIGWSLNDLGLIALEQGDLEWAALLFEESQGLFRELGDIRDLATSLGNLGNLAQELGNIDQAEADFRSALELFREAGDKGIAMVACLANLGEMAQAHGDVKRAKLNLVDALSLAYDIGAKHLIAFTLMVLSWVAADEGQHEYAAQLLSIATAQQDILTARIGLADRATHERYLASIKTQLGPTRFTLAWAKGQSMTVEQVISYALDETVQPTSHNQNVKSDNP